MEPEKQSITQDEISDSDETYESSDTAVCPSCEPDPDDPERHCINPLPAFRRTAANGCIRCRLLAAGIDKFQSFWTGSEPGQSGHGESWNEDEIEVSVTPAWPVDDHEHGTQVTLWRPMKKEKNYDFLALEFYSHKDEDNESPRYGFCPADDVPERSDSDSSFSTIQSWMNTCQEKHEMCRMNQSQGHMPTRLIHVGSAGEKLRLCLTSEVGGITGYAALSHSWGEKESRKTDVPKTTKSNLKSRMKNIKWKDLTNTFQDAVEITRRLGLEYLWVDSLCINQDDYNDWALEASRVGRIYENARIVIAATRSRTGDGGCFSTRSPSYEISEAAPTGRFYVRKEISHLDMDDQPLENYKTMPLFARAWVFQERLLATRVIHYTEHEIMWECKQDLHCECQGIKNERQWQGMRPSTVKLEHWRLLASESDMMQRCMHWSTIVNTYLARSLTYDRDRLPALSGIARQMHLPKEMGRYLAGMWEGSLPLALCWVVNANYKVRNWGQRRRPPKWRAPSWCWASVVVENGWYIITTNFEPEDEIKNLHCRIHEAECELKSADPYGEVKDGHLILSVEAFWATFRRKKPWIDNGDKLRYGGYELHFGGHPAVLSEDVPLEAGNEKLRDETPILIAVIYSALSQNNAPGTYWVGLALKPSSREGHLHAYERIGMVVGSDLPKSRQTMEITIV
ncbi:hypothetical protein LTS13_008303 [Exophiala xenobiotica]|nr:hypothetical protein LTR93_005862 [Exophiala xenobiotica]KAK5366542.1 hypothetical protein LTS13_008303 [Exophiala xenobiotica]KAK5395160.1 hypothetical protein LTR79_007776 [Exophiala xenobiotica]KAK5491669.1 hypothetical protein LTR83_006510 [Exophiala xenobiotica]KAK5517136.1 hypothetical protein LTR07_006918 [Exophiala xenobiotica]